MHACCIQLATGKIKKELIIKAILLLSYPYTNTQTIINTVCNFKEFEAVW